MPHNTRTDFTQMWTRLGPLADPGGPPPNFRLMFCKKRILGLNGQLLRLYKCKKRSALWGFVAIPSCSRGPATGPGCDGFCPRPPLWVRALCAHHVAPKALALDSPKYESVWGLDWVALGAKYYSLKLIGVGRDGAESGSYRTCLLWLRVSLVTVQH